MTGMGTETTAGLDLLGILAEEVDWDPQQKQTPGAAQLAVLGHGLESHHEAKGKLWAGHLLGGLGLFEEDGRPRNLFSQLDATIPLKAQRRESPSKACHVTRTRPSQLQTTTSVVDDPLNTMTLTKRTALFYENLYERFCPGIVPRAYIYPKLGRKSHNCDPVFAGLALSISLLGLLGLTLPASQVECKADDDISGEVRKPFIMPYVSQDCRSRRGHDPGQLQAEALRLVERVLSLRWYASGGGSCFGQAPTLETVLTSFFLSLALYNLHDMEHEGDTPTFIEWKDASFFRFCEAVTLAKILGLDQLGSAPDPTCAPGHGGRAVVEEVKVWSLLVRAERWWAEQKPGYVCQLETVIGGTRRRRKSDPDEDRADARHVKRERRTKKEGPKALSFLVELGFGSIRDELLYPFHDYADCWVHRCDRRACRKLTAEAVVRIHDSLSSFDMSPAVEVAADPVLVDLARQTLRSKLWIASLQHNLISTQADTQAPLRPDQPLHVALDTLDLLEDLDQLVLCSLPSSAAMAKVLQVALQEIRDCVAILPGANFAEDSFSFEQIAGSDDSGSSERGADDGRPSNSTTIKRAAQSVIENLDRFLHRAEMQWRPCTSST